MLRTADLSDTYHLTGIALIYVCSLTLLSSCINTLGKFYSSTFGKTQFHRLKSSKTSK